MAEVRDGVDRRLRRPVAIKTLLPHLASRPDLRARFEAEARSAARLSHPNAVGVFDVGEDDGRPFIIMERLPGETLADRIQVGNVDTVWLRSMAIDVLDALAAAHDAGIVHRDVKPGNILIAADGRAKIADFGIAKSLDAAGDTTASGQLLGTPAYLAPERLNGAPASPRADIYSLGVVLYEALAGEKPFTGETPVLVARAVGQGQHRPLADIRPDLDGALVVSVERAMRTDPEARFASARDMQTALGPVTPRDATAVLTLPPSPAGRPDRPSTSTRRAVAVAAAVGAFVLLTLGAIGAFSSQGSERGSVTPTTAAPVATTSPPSTAAPVAQVPPTVRKHRGHGKD